MDRLKLDPQNPLPEEVTRVVSVLNSGGVVVLPTETVYTLAADATNENAVKKVFEIKGRDYKKPIHVVVSSLEQAEKYVEIDKNARLLAQKFLPGPLTLVLPKKPVKTPELLTSGLPTLGIRIPDLPLNVIVAKKLGRPYTTTSANISGGPNPYSIEEVLSQIPEKRIDLLVDIGPLPHLLPSTLLDTTQSPPKILRQGPIPEEQIIKALQ